MGAGSVWRSWSARSGKEDRVGGDDALSGGEPVSDGDPHRERLAELDRPPFEGPGSLLDEEEALVPAHEQGGGRDDQLRRLLALQGHPREHAWLQAVPLVGELDAHPDGPGLEREHVPDELDAALEAFPWISAELQACVVTDADPLDV